MGYNSFFILGHLDELVDDSLNNLLHFDEHVFRDFDFLDNFLDDWYLDPFLNFPDDFSDNLLFHNLFYDLGNLDNLLDDSWHDDNFFDDLLDLDHLGNLD